MVQQTECCFRGCCSERERRKWSPLAGRGPGLLALDVRLPATCQSQRGGDDSCHDFLCCSRSVPPSRQHHANPGAGYVNAESRVFPWVAQDINGLIVVMACGTSQGSSAEEEEGLLSVSYCRSQGEEHLASPMEELSNGQVLLVLTAHEASFTSTLDMNRWAERLTRLGIQVTADQWKNLIQGTVLQPEVKQYLFYNSRGFGITIAVVLYVTLWTNLYSTLVIFSAGPSWEFSIVATVIALLVALAVRLIIYRHQRKWNTNTDMRLSAANEVFMRQDFLVGITDLPHKLHSAPRLWFVHFKMGPCLQYLEDTVAEMKRIQKDDICIVIETAISPTLGKRPASSLEELSLLPERRVSNQGALTHRETLCLLPEGPPGETARCLLTIFASYYIRLLVLGQLPEVPVRRHIDLGHVPCPCQFIEASVLGERS